MAKKAKAAQAEDAGGRTSKQGKSKGKSKSKSKGKQVWKLMGSTSALLAGAATARALDATWRTATGRKPPTRPESPAIAAREALLWAGLSGMAIGVAKTYATRRAAQYWVKSTGSLPPGMSVDDKKGKGKEKGTDRDKMEEKGRRKLAES